MAKGTGLSFKTKVDISESKARLLELKKLIGEVGGISMGGTGNSSANFTAAQNQMTRAMRASLLETERLRQENLQLQNQWQRGAITVNELTARQRENTLARQAEVRAQREARQNQTSLNGSYREAQQRLTALGREIREAEGGFRSLGSVQQARIREYRELNAQLTAFDRTMGNHQRNVGNYQSALQGLRGLAATYLSGAAILAGGRQLLTLNMEVSDSLSDVQRTAGLTASEVENLSEQLKKIDTRTSLKGLLDIAVIGGQLGIAKEQLVGFTTAINQLSVALGGELKGGPEGIAKSLGVLDNVFGITQKNAGDVEKSFNQIGSAILGLGQSGLATGDFLADFGERVGGLAKQAGLSLPVILSYGAVLQENGVSAEVAGSSFKRLISALTTNRQKFFAVAQLADSNLTLKDFTNIINTDTKKALDLFFAGLSKGGKTTTGFNDILKSLRLSGAGVSQTVAALANNQENLNGHVEQATRDFQDASIAAEQYALKNDNLAGSWDKLGNTIKNALTSGPVSGFFKVIIDGINSITQKMIGVTKSKSWMEFFTRLTPFANAKGFDVANRITENFKQRSSLSYDLNSLFDKKETQGKDLGLDELRKAYTDALEAQRQASKDYRDYRDGVANETLKNTDGQLERLKNQFDYLKDQTKYFGDEFTKAKSKLPKSTVVGGGEGSSQGIAKIDAARIRAAESFSKKLTDLHNASFRKTLSNDDAEIQAVKDKYQKFKEEADKFYKDSKSPVVKLNGKNVSKDQVFGTLKADEKAETDAILTKRQAEKDKKEQEKAKEHYEKLLSEFADYGQKMDKAKAKFEYDSELLKNDPRQLAIRKAAYDKEVQDLTDANTKKLDEYEKLIEGIDQLSRKEALAALNIAREVLANDKIAKTVSEKVAKETEKLFDKTEKAIIKGTKAAGEELIDLANQMDQVVSSVGGMDTAFGKVLGTVSNVVGQVGNIKKGVSDFKDADTGLGKLTAGLGILGAGISIFKTVFSLFDRSKEREEQAAYERDLQNKQTEAVNKALERQIALLDEAYGTDRIKKYAEAIQQAQDNEAKYQDQLKTRFILTGDKTLDKFIEELNATGTVKQLQNLGGYKAVNNLRNQLTLLPKDIDELRTLLDEGKLDAATSTIVQNLIKANEVAQDLANSLNAENVGSSLSQIADDFIKTLTDGTQDFGKSFEETIRTSILNGFKGELIRTQLQEFYTQFAELSKGGLTQDEITALRGAYSRAAEKAKQDILDLEAATGIKLGGDGPDTAKKTGVSGAIVGEALTEGTANRMLGISQGQYDLTKGIHLTLGDMYKMATNNFQVATQIAANTLRTADNTTGIGDKLDKIVTNTTPKTTSGDPLGQSLRDAGITG